MGMDVYGKAPVSETGEYLRHSVWSWRPLAEYVCEVAPEICSECKYWQSNDGDGLDAKGSRELAAVLRRELEAGKTRDYAERQRVLRDSLPLETCSICEGKGIRTKEDDLRLGVAGVVKDPNGQRCNGCRGTGEVKNWDCHYPFEVNYVAEFALFLENCGGFEIW